MTPARRRLLVGAAALVASGGAFAQAGGPLRGFTDPAVRRSLLDEGERLLAAGEPEAAERAFDRAAQLGHDADTEVALVRTYVQLGQFRRALAFCAHASDVHRNVVDGAALYVWLLQLGGQVPQATQRLADARLRFGELPALRALQAALNAPYPQADGLLREAPLRFAPYARSLDTAAPGPGARVVGTATLWPDGSAALAPAAALEGARSVWLRDGLGRTVQARVGTGVAEPGLVWLQPAPGLDALPESAPPAAEPTGGRPGYTVEFAARADAEPEWPVLRLGFLGGPGMDPAVRRLGLDLPPGPRGGPVLDEAGRFVGVATAGGRWVPASALRRPAAPPAAGAPRAAPDEAYERGLRLALQLIVAQAPPRRRCHRRFIDAH